MLQPHLLDSVLRAIRRLAEQPGYVLDLSCGDGQLLQRLHALGYHCHGTRYCEHDYIRVSDRPLSPDIRLDNGIDLHQPLPYQEGQFDLVLMTEVLEHLRHHETIVAEVGRILRPGGIFLLTTPNIQRLHSRWQFLLTGTHKLIRRRVGWDLKSEDLYAYHTNPVSFPFMHTLLHQAGMQVEQLGWTRCKLKHIHWLTAYPLLWLATHLTLGGSPRDPAAYREGEQDLRRWMLHPAMLASEQLLVVARRSASASTRVDAA